MLKKFKKKTILTARRVDYYVFLVEVNHRFSLAKAEPIGNRWEIREEDNQSSTSILGTMFPRNSKLLHKDTKQHHNNQSLLRLTSFCTSRGNPTEREREGSYRMWTWLWNLPQEKQACKMTIGGHCDYKWCRPWFLRCFLRSRELRNLIFLWID